MKRLAFVPVAITVLLTSVACMQVACTQVASAQSDERDKYPDRPRYPSGLLSVEAGLGLNKYTGEFTGSEVGYAGSVAAAYALIPSLDAAVQLDFGQARYLRRPRHNTAQMYRFQFGDQGQALRSTSYTTMELQGRLNLFPSMFFNAYLLAGVGGTLFTPEDYTNGDARFSSSTPMFTLSIPVGAGFEYRLDRSWAIHLQVKNNFLLTREFDAFDTEELRRVYNEMHGTPGDPNQAATPGDTYLHLLFGLRFYLGEDEDYDDDGLSNSAEEKAGTNPFDPDTDGDKLTDYEELMLYGTDPLLRDTDGDILNDYIEVMKYRTDPLLKDTDGDGLGDREELLDYHTDPTAIDTEGDGLIDSEEKRLGTDPKRMDTDGDGLYDGDEVILYKTSPVLPDSDGEGLTDFEELNETRTNALKADTDRDGLNDYEESRVFETNPKNPDTDGDGVSDYDELKKLGSDPLVPEIKSGGE